MRDVSWSDVFFGMVLSGVIIASVWLVTLVILLTLDVPSSIRGINLMYPVFLAAGFGVCLLAVRAYPGPKSDFGPWWAWAAFVLAIPAITGGAQIVFGGISSETLSGIASSWIMQVSYLSPAIVLSIYMSGRDKAIPPSEAASRDY